MRARGIRMQESDCDYLTRRAREERDAAARAASEKARDIHARLAERYTDAAAALNAADDGADNNAGRAIISRVSIDAERKASPSTSPPRSQRPTHSAER